MDNNDQLPLLQEINDFEVDEQTQIGTIVHCFQPKDADLKSFFVFSVIKGTEFAAIERFKGCLTLQKVPEYGEEICVRISDGRKSDSGCFFLRPKYLKMFSNAITVLKIEPETSTILNFNTEAALQLLTINNAEDRKVTISQNHLSLKITQNYDDNADFNFLRKIVGKSKNYNETALLIFHKNRNPISPKLDGLSNFKISKILTKGLEICQFTINYKREYFSGENLEISTSSRIVLKYNFLSSR